MDSTPLLTVLPQLSSRVIKKNHFYILNIMQIFYTIILKLVILYVAAVAPVAKVHAAPLAYAAPVAKTLF